MGDTRREESTFYRKPQDRLWTNNKNISMALSSGTKKKNVKWAISGSFWESLRKAGEHKNQKYQLDRECHRTKATAFCPALEQVTFVLPPPGGR